MRYLALLLGVCAYAQGPYTASCSGLRGVDLYRAEMSGCEAGRIESQTPFATRAPEPVSLYRLTHKVPKPARREFDAARKHIQKKEFLRAEERLAAALESDADFADALAQLGVLQLMRGEFASAERHLARSADLDEGNALIAGYASVARMFGGKAGEAARLARLALKLDPGNVQARKVLDRRSTPR